jgi:hypothetical protein
MSAESDAIAKRAAWEEKRRQMKNETYIDLYGRWKCWETVVTRPCTNFGVVVDGNRAYCDVCGTPAPDAARILGIEMTEEE